MEQESFLFIIPFRPLLSKICSVLGFAAPIFSSNPWSVHDCFVLVCTNEPQGLVYFEGDEGSFTDNAERTSKKMVLHFVKEYKLHVDDVNLKMCEQFEHVLHVFKLKRKQLDMVESGTPSMPIAESTSENAVVHSGPVVSIDFFELLAEIVRKLGIPVTRVEFLQYRMDDFKAWMGVKCPGSITDLRWFESEHHVAKAGARECLARKAIHELMVMYRFRVVDVNYNAVLEASLTARLERESFLALRERVYGVEEETVAYPSLQEETELTPRGVESVIPELTVAPKPPKKTTISTFF